MRPDPHLEEPEPAVTEAQGPPSSEAPGTATRRERTGPDRRPPASPPPQVGARVKHYELLRQLGEGGMGTVFLARDTTLGRLVAIKVLQSHTGLSAERFLIEAQATARCRHDNIVVIHEVDEVDGYPYMVLEYLEGRTLREWMAQRERPAAAEPTAPDAAPAGLVSPSLAVELVLPVVRALSCAHELGIVHRDLKPVNIVLTSSGRVVVLDFGIAKRLGASELSAMSTAARPQREGPILTQEGALLGTLPYMSPEQLRSEDIDGRSDLWSVGIILYELLTGAHPLASRPAVGFLETGTSEEPMPAVCDRRPDAGALGPIVDRCLSKRRDDRHRSADELLAALEALGSGRRAALEALAEEDSPFAGLSAFQEADAERYVGREREVVGLIGRLRNQPLLVVAGPSGAGKSSFVRAGVIPALKRSGERWEAFTLRPGRRPLAALADMLAQIAPATEEDAQAGALAAGSPDALLGAFRTQPGLVGVRLRARCRRDGRRHRILLFVDQFEELYTLGADEAERAAFVACLEGAADDASSPLRVVLSLRSDFLDRMAQDGHFLAEVTRALYFLRPMGREGLREALTRPLEAVGYRFENEDMVAAMLAGLERTRSPLPLLQFTAAKLWEARDRTTRRLTQASYDQLGGVAGALSAHANAVLAALSVADQRLCRAVLLRLCTPERTRAVVSLADLRGLAADGDAVEQVIHRLSDARLVLVEAGGDAREGVAREGATVELCHESLTESWDKLRQWLSESEQDAQFVARLATAARQWEASDEAQGLLWRDRAAREAADWLARRRAELEAGEPLGLGKREERFLLSVVALAQRTRRLRRRIAAGVLATACAVAAVMVVLAIGLERQAASARIEARQARNATRMAAARELEQRDPTAMLALLREVEPPDVPRGWAELASKALRSGVAREVKHWGEPAYSAAWSPDGRRVVVALHDGTARVFGPGDPAEPIVLRGHRSFVWSAAFSPDGTRIVTASGDRTARVWRADGTAEPIVLRGHQDEVTAALFSPDGARVVTASMDGTARVWRADGTAEPLVLRGHDAQVISAAFSPDGARIVTASVDETARVWNTDGAGEPLVFRGHEAAVGTAAFSPDGARIVTGSSDATVRIWSADGAGEPLVLRGHEHWVRQVSFSPDGRRVLSASKDRTVRIWSAGGTGEPLVLRGHDNWVYTAAFSPDGASIVTASLDNTTRVFRIDLLGAPLRLRGHDSVVWQVAFSSDGRRIVTASEDSFARVFRADGTGEPAVLRGHEGPVFAAAFGPGDRRIVTASADRTARVWRADGTGEPVILRGHDEPVYIAAFSPDGRRIVTGSADRTARIWSADGAGEPVILRGHEQRVSSAAFSPDGARIATASEDRTVRIWNADGAGEPRVLRDPSGIVPLVLWSPDGARLITASQDGTARVWRIDRPGAPVVLRGHEQAVTWAAWSPDGRRIVTASEDRTARVWRADGGGEPVVLRGHERGLFFAAFGPDGARVVTASQDATARIWNADGAGVPYVLSHGHAVLAAAWSPDGARVVTRVGEDSTAWLWAVRAPFRGTGDPRLWTATPYCLSAERRIALLSMTEDRARADQVACERRIEAARSGRP